MAKKKSDKSEVDMKSNPEAKTPESKTPESSAKHSVPMPDPKPKGKRSFSLMDKIRKKTQPKTKTSASKVSRPPLVLSEDSQDKFVEFAGIKVASEILTKRSENLYSQVVKDAWDSYIDLLWSCKHQPVNPEVKAKSDGVEATSIFSVSTGSSIKIEMPEMNEDESEEEALIRKLVSFGVSRMNATRLVENEVSVVPSINLNLSRLMSGKTEKGNLIHSSDVERDAGENLYCGLTGMSHDGEPISIKDRLKYFSSITEEGWEAVQKLIEDDTTCTPSLVFGGGFFDRVCDYAESKEELKSIMRLFRTTLSFRSVDVVADDNKEHLKNVVVDIINKH